GLRQTADNAPCAGSLLQERCPEGAVAAERRCRSTSALVIGAPVDRRFWHLVVQFALKDFKIRYTHSVLGYAWSVLQPLVFSVVYYFVFTTFLHFDAHNFPG